MRDVCLVCGETFSNIECHTHYDEHQRILNVANKEQPKMRCTCAKCDITFASITDYQKHICGMEIKMSPYICRNCGAGFEKLIQYEKHTEKEVCKEKPKMTREEALNKLKTIKTPLSVENIVDILEEVGLLEFEEEREVARLCSYERNDLGMIKIEEWPEGLVLWVGGEIKWKSWIQYWRKGDGVMIEYYDGFMDEKKKQTGIIV